jgi:hypothetical protein
MFAFSFANFSAADGMRWFAERQRGGVVGFQSRKNTACFSIHSTCKVTLTA